MFDIDDYLNDGTTTGSGLMDSGSPSIEDEIIDDIESIVSTANERLYGIERFRQNKHSIDILFPKIQFPGNTAVIKTANQVRFDLSTYPFEEDLMKISKIVLRPKHIEISGIELVALYLPSRKILVHYLSVPRRYDISGTRLSDAEMFMPYDITTISDKHYLGQTQGKKENSPRTVSSLFYLISTISDKTDNDIDKFFSRTDPSKDGETLTMLDDISRHYYKFGY